MKRIVLRLRSIERNAGLLTNHNASVVLASEQERPVRGSKKECKVFFVPRQGRHSGNGVALFIFYAIVNFSKFAFKS